MPIHHQSLVRRLDSDKRVLEVGPGAFAYPRADVLCDRYSRYDAEAYKQDGNVARPAYSQPLILYSDVRTPFVDRAFDYVICSHVLEHVHRDEIHAFVAELTRVARGGYLEFPSYVLELISNVEVHRWLINVVDGEIRLLDKSRVREVVEQVAGTLGPIFERLSAESLTYQRLYQSYLPIWVVGLEWEGAINFRIVDSFDELVDSAARMKLIDTLVEAERNRHPQPLIKRLPRAIKNRLKRILTAGPAARTQVAQNRLPGWLSDVTVCPDCARAGVRFYPEAAHCDGCDTHYAAREGEYLFYLPATVSSSEK